MDTERAFDKFYILSSLLTLLRKNKNRCKLPNINIYLTPKADISLTGNTRSSPTM